MNSQSSIGLHCCCDRGPRARATGISALPLLLRLLWPRTLRNSSTSIFPAGVPSNRTSPEGMESPTLGTEATLEKEAADHSRAGHRAEQERRSEDLERLLADGMLTLHRMRVCSRLQIMRVLTYADMLVERLER